MQDLNSKVIFEITFAYDLTYTVEHWTLEIAKIAA